MYTPATSLQTLNQETKTFPFLLSPYFCTLKNQKLQIVAVYLEVGVIAKWCKIQRIEIE